MRRIALDHVGVVARDLAALAAEYERLGFTLTPVALQAEGRVGNRCAMLQGSYLELLAVVDPDRGSATLDRFLARYAGVHILAFGIADPSAELARLRRAGFAAAAIAHSERAVDDADPGGARARFALIQLPDQPEGRFNLVQHLTREALWQERFLHHANNAVSLEEVALAVEDPFSTAARLSALIGCVATPDRAGGLVLEVAHGRVRLLPPDRDSPAVPSVARIAVRTSDRNAAICRLLAERGIAHDGGGGAVVVPATLAGGVAVCFLPGA